MQFARAVLYCRLWPVCFYHIFPRKLTNGTILGGKKFIERKMCFDFLYNFSLKHFSLQEEQNKISQECTRTGFPVK